MTGNRVVFHSIMGTGNNGYVGAAQQNGTTVVQPIESEVLAREARRIGYGWEALQSH